jgi:hypothetical protein
VRRALSQGVISRHDKAKHFNINMGKVPREDDRLWEYAKSKPLKLYLWSLTYSRPISHPSIQALWLVNVQPRSLLSIPYYSYWENSGQTHSATAMQGRGNFLIYSQPSRNPYCTCSLAYSYKTVCHSYHPIKIDSHLTHTSVYLITIIVLFDT